MSRFTLALCAFAVVIFCTAAKPANETPACDPSRRWNFCGSACPRTCYDPPNHKCIKMCVPRCECLPGMVEHKGLCIYFENCELK